MEANYTIKAEPYQKEWREADKIQVVFTLKLPNETKVFKGLIDITAILKNGV